MGTLPIYPYTLTTTIDGVTYEVHPLTDSTQVITEDGLLLNEILKSLVSETELNDALKPFNLTAQYFRFKGVLNTLPDLKAIDQLYAKTGNQTGDVYLVEASIYGAVDTVYELYVWVGKLSLWAFCGSTSKTGGGTAGLPDTLKLFPETLGKPGQYLIVDESGKGLTWGYGGGSTGVEAHNLDVTSHPSILKELSLKADKLLIFNDTLLKNKWVYTGEGAYFTYIYQNANLPKSSYFELTPIYQTPETAAMIMESEIQPAYNIFNTDADTYAVIRALRVPADNIEVCIKCFGTYTAK